MKEQTIEDLFNDGIERRDKGSLDSAVEIFLNIIERFPKHPKLSKVHTRAVVGVAR